MAVIKGDAGVNMLIGTRESDSLSGFGGDDRLYGLRGNDDIDGGEGADLMSGRVGDDIYWVDDLGDRVVERLDEGFFDQVRSTVSYVLTRNVEHLVLIGTADIDGYGNALENILIGNEGGNVLNGRGGLDRLEGRAGNDVYVVDDLDQEVDSYGVGLDRVIERAGEGIDTVRLGVRLNEYLLPDNVENLIMLEGSFADGNDLDNFIRGSDQASFIAGGDGADRILGRGGNDFLEGGAGTDVLIGGEGNDTLTDGGEGGRVYGGLGNDIIQWRAGSASISMWHRTPAMPISSNTSRRERIRSTWIGPFTAG
jgi:Ca2+-binding RTX toxin-like protein